MADGGPATWGI